MYFVIAAVVVVVAVVVACKSFFTKQRPLVETALKLAKEAKRKEALMR